MEKRKNLKLNAEKIKMLSSQYELLLQAWSENAMLFHDMSNHLTYCTVFVKIICAASFLTGTFWFRHFIF